MPEMMMMMMTMMMMNVGGLMMTSARANVHLYSVVAELSDCKSKLSRLQCADTDCQRTGHTDRTRLTANYQPDRLLEELRSLQVLFLGLRST